MMISRDHGATWTVGTPAFSGGNECQAAQLGDGSIMLNMRNDHERFRAVFVTQDLGADLAAARNQPQHADRAELQRQPAARRLRTGRRSRSTCCCSPTRTRNKGARTRRSRSASTTAAPGRESHHLLLDEGRGAGYPSLTRVDDRHVGIVYEGSQSHLVFEKFSLDELLKR